MEPNTSNNNRSMESNFHDEDNNNTTPTTIISNLTSSLTKSLSFLLHSFLLVPFTDETGSKSKIASGLTGLFLEGLILGCIMPKDTAEEEHTTNYFGWYPTLTSVIGYTYFLSWSISFYPQTISNFRRRSTSGLSPDFVHLNFIGFVCYGTYTMMLYWDAEVRREYRERNGGSDPPVRGNDVAFVVNACVMTTVVLFQIWWFGEDDGEDAEGRGDEDGESGVPLLPSSPSRSKRRVKLHPLILVFSILLIIIIFFYILEIKFNERHQTIGLLYFLSLIKILISVAKYIPQVILNIQRRSTVGWNIWNIILDFTGGMLSILQLILDSWVSDGDWASGIRGDWAKFGLGLISIFFDIIFFLQHYVFYKNDDVDDVVDNGEDTNLTPLLQSAIMGNYDTDDLPVL